MSKYIVSLAVDGRVNVEVEAKTAEEAFDKAKESCDWISGDVEVVGVKPVNCTHKASGELTDY